MLYFIHVHWKKTFDVKKNFNLIIVWMNTIRINNLVVWDMIWLKGLFLHLSSATIFFLSINNHSLIPVYGDAAFDISQFNATLFVERLLQNTHRHMCLCGDGKLI